MAFHQLMTNTDLGFHSLLYGANIEMVSINDVREANAKGKSIKGLVCVFVGGTGGIGASTAQELFRRTTSPKAYIIGRYVFID